MVALPDKFIWRKCQCPCPTCDDWHIQNFGKFVQGSGFKPHEKEALDRLLEERKS